ncbi:MAG TPA: V-type ATPase subunit [Anaerolineales bacterium]|nr:V-type ATPase subunit [Anaerolineales bacterium]
MTAFDYGNARLRAMKSRLLDRGRLAMLAEARDLPALIAGLADTPYRPSIEAALTRASGAGVVARALLQDIQATVEKIKRCYPDEAAPALWIILRRYDLHNLKAVLRGLARGAAPDSIAEAWLPPGELGEPVLRDLAGLGDVRHAIDRMATLRLPFSAPLLALRGERPGAGLAEMDRALTRWYFHISKSELAQSGEAAEVLAEDLDWQADIEDLLTMLRFVHPVASRAAGDSRAAGADGQQGELRRRLLGEGRLPPRVLAAAGAEDSVESAVRSLQGTRYGEALRAGFRRFQVSNRLSDIEVELRGAHLKNRVARFRTDPLGAGVPLGYLALKTNEIAALRWIARGIAAQLPAVEIKAGIP